VDVVALPEQSERLPAVLGGGYGPIEEATRDTYEQQPPPTKPA
jgi:hypothetical protein